MEKRKKAHLHLAFNSVVTKNEADKRFDYEPLFSAHPTSDPMPFSFVGKTMKYPFWISSMTGGTQKAAVINKNLARACGEFGLGMGLGSCRVLLESDEHFNDFDVRPFMGDDAPLYSNIGISQLEFLVKEKATDKITKLNSILKTDGVIIHINPLQEMFQPEGDRLTQPAIETIQEFIETSNERVIIKEVGQGMGYQSIEALLRMDIEAIEFGALGGTNFSKMEMKRRIDHPTPFSSMAKVGHTAEEMTEMVNHISRQIKPRCKQVIISGGITSILDGYYLHQICQFPSVFGMGATFLKYAMEDYDKLRSFIESMIESWQSANAFLRVRNQD